MLAGPSLVLPQAYGFCVACHSRDLINYVYNSLTGSNLFLAPISANAVAAGTLPVLTIIEVIIGAVAAALLYKEFRVKKGDAKSYVVYGIGGILFLVKVYKNHSLRHTNYMLRY